MNKIKVSFHFHLSEFECPCCGRVKIDEVLLQKLEALRILWGMPLRITSGYRCEKHNKEVDGSDNSLHMEGKAVDVAVDEENQGKVLTLAKLVGLRVIPYPKRGFVHLDIGGEKFGHLSSSIELGVSDSSKLLSFNPA